MSASITENARFNMIEQQIRPCEVIDERVLSTLRTVPRENFVGDEYLGLAFADIHVPLNDSEVMMKPMQEGVMLQALDIKPGDKVLEVGTGSGFITACLLAMGGKVTSYEIDEQLSTSASARLDAAGMQGAHLAIADIFQTSLAKWSFDAIAVTGSVPANAEHIENFLAPGGRMFIVTGEAPVMSATFITRSANGQLSRKALCETLLPALRNAPQPERFSF